MCLWLDQINLLESTSNWLEKQDPESDKTLLTLKDVFLFAELNDSKNAELKQDYPVGYEIQQTILPALSGVVLGVYNRIIKRIGNDKLFLDCTAVHMYDYRYCYIHSLF